MYQDTVLIHSKYLLSEADAGYAFYLIASNSADIQFFRLTEHITKWLGVEADQPPQMPGVLASHTRCVSPAVILFL